ncbi:IS66-like element accessory protein TnpA [Rhizobium metallidurans]|uniref:Transposase n=1 Tax=Rhizobium metallidurans TaxID=1265931 RepID=A0A7W6CUH1_9HYPH|nr:transposase [Rhizobium metallidurans]MBB3967395.1 transposase [Rhizobium metallidurans]
MAGEDDNAMLGVMDEGMHEGRHDGRYRRIEVITGRRKRRDWTDEEKARIVCESAEPDVNISAVARRYGVNRGLLNAWRRAAGLTGRRVDKALVQEPAFVPVNVVGVHASQRAMSSESASGGAGRIEIELDGARMTVVGSVEPKLAQAMLTALRCRR